MITPEVTSQARRSSMAGPLTVEKPQDLAQHVGKDLGPSDWVTVDQAMIDKFADATGDHQWIHVDVERARREMPGGKTIAHGYLTLSLVPRLASTLVKVSQVSRGVNYGSNKVRFTSTVPAGSRIRLHQKIVKVEPVEGNGVRVTTEVKMEVEGQERPALVAEIMGIRYGK
jgi:acyl dehydratase